VVELLTNILKIDDTYKLIIKDFNAQCHGMYCFINRLHESNRFFTSFCMPQTLNETTAGFGCIILDGSFLRLERRPIVIILLLAARAESIPAIASKLEVAGGICVAYSDI
jgi:hypothetical protein